MARTSRCFAALLTALPWAGLVLACGGPAPVHRGLVVNNPTVEAGVTPLRLAVYDGRTTGADVLIVRVNSGEEAYAFEARARGIALAFRGSADRDLAELRTRVSDVGGGAALREPASASAFVVDLPHHREDLLEATLEAAASPPALRFLIEVRPHAAYVFDHVPARLAADGDAPWPDTAESFTAFKTAEVERYLAARAGGGGYAPSRAGYRVAPVHGTPAAEPGDFVVLEEDVQPAHVFGRGDLVSPEVTRDASGRAAVAYQIRAERQAAFEAWTTANIGLPMALVVEGQVLSAPTIHAPLSDAVQITLSGSMTEARRDAGRLAGALVGKGAATDADFVAGVAWRRDGAFEAWVPLAEGAERRVAFEIQSGPARNQSSVEFPLRHAPGVDISGATAAKAAVVGSLLGLTPLEESATALRGWLPESVAHLAEVVASDATARRRAEAAYLLGAVDPSSEVAMQALLKIGADAPTEVRRSATLALGLLERFDLTLPALDAAVRDGEPSVRDAAVRALSIAGRGRPEAAEALLRASAHRDDRAAHAARQALGELLPEADPVLRAAAEGADENLRAAALQVIGMQGRPDDVPLLLERARTDPSTHVRVSALRGLQYAAATHPDEWAVSASELAPLLEDPDASVAGAAALVLALTGEAARPVLLGALTSDVPRVRWAGVSGLVNLEGDESSEALVRALLDDEWPKTRLAAAWVLARWTREVEPFLGALRVALRGDDREAATLAIASLQMLGPAGAPVADDVRPYLDDTDHDTRIGAALALEAMQCGDERTKALIEAAGE